MNEREFANKIKQDLNYGLGRLAPEVTARLKSAREQALQAYAAREMPAGELAMAGHGHAHHPVHVHSAKWFSVAMLLALLAGGAWYWQNTSSPQDDDIDAALLAGDLPVTAYVDHDFHTWLDQSSQSR